MKPSNLWVLVIPIILMYCNKDENLQINLQDMWDCHHETTWDSISTKYTLMGEWEWEYIDCFWNPEDANGEDYKGLTIEFKSDNTLDVKESGQITQTSKWKVVYEDGDLYGIDVSPRVIHLYGGILFCDERVVFNAAYKDLCDNYFKRK